MSDYPGVEYESETDHTPGTFLATPPTTITPPRITPPRITEGEMRAEALRTALATNPGASTAVIISAAGEIEAYLRGDAPSGGDEGTQVLPEAGSGAGSTPGGDAGVTRTGDVGDQG